jgi:uncharacterized protein YvpB
MLGSKGTASIKKGSIRKRYQIYLEDPSEDTMEKIKMIIFKGRKNFVWIITVHSKNNIKMFEFYTEKEAKETFKKIKGCKILTEVIYW